MLSNAKRKIKSAHRPLPLIAVVAALLILAGFVIFGSSRPSYVVARMPGGDIFRLHTANTPEQRTRGLSDYKLLNPNEGMLFIYGQPGVKCIWMKGMNFPLDILWLDGSKSVTAAESRVFPNTYPRQFCHEGAYVIELPIGTARGIDPGQQIDF